MLSLTKNLLLANLGSRQNKKIKFIFLVTLIISLTFYVWVCWILFHDRMKDEQFTGKKKCPACYGESLCPFIGNGSLKLDGWSKYQPLDIANVKNVHTGIFKGKQIILKKLARPNELKSLDEKLCQISGYPKVCDVTRALESSPIITARELDVHLLKGMSDFMACPSQRLIGVLREKFREDIKKKRGRELSFFGRSHLLTTLMVNPEPLVMQIFPQKKGWPFPEYLGACGRLIGVEDCGVPLTEFYMSAWEERVHYAYQIMNIAERFTNNENGFALYWTDLNYDNMVVNNQGKVIVVDLENIIVVDKAKIKREKLAGWDEPYHSSFDECPGGDASCVSYSLSDLCTRYTSDFNYYTACRNVLSQFAGEPHRPGGLLHSLPPKIENKLRPLLSECVRPVLPGGRLLAKDKLIKELRIIKDDYL